jgi:hypothetical protein
MQKNKPDAPKNWNKTLNTYARYSSLAFQMMAIMLAFVFAGFKLDEWTGWKFPIFKVILSMAGVSLAIYYAIKDFIRKP